MDVMEKLTILTDAAKYDAACTSSGARRGSRQGYIGNTSSSVAGCCHTFSADGRCVTLLKVLMTNCCVYDCKYCVNRCSNDARRAAFTPEELAELTIQFYRRNYIEGLFLSSGVMVSPDYTTERMIRCLELLREGRRFNGYIHAKAIPGTSPELVRRLGLLADRLSVNIELPSERGLQTLAPNKTRKAIFRPMGLITRHPAGEQGGAGEVPPRPPLRPRRPEHPDDHWGHGGHGPPHPLPHPGALRQVPAQAGVLLRLRAGGGELPPPLPGHQAAPAAGAPALPGGLAAAVLRLPGGGAAGRGGAQLQSPGGPQVHLGPAPPGVLPRGGEHRRREDLLRVPGIGVVSARRILYARRARKLEHGDLKKLGVVLKRAQYFITCKGKMLEGLPRGQDGVLRNLVAVERASLPPWEGEQLSLFDGA